MWSFILYILFLSHCLNVLIFLTMHKTVLKFKQSKTAWPNIVLVMFEVKIWRVLYKHMCWTKISLSENNIYKFHSIWIQWPFFHFEIVWWHSFNNVFILLNYYILLKRFFIALFVWALLVDGQFAYYLLTKSISNLGSSNYLAHTFLGFSFYVSNTTTRLQGTLCFKDKSFSASIIPAMFNTTCILHGQYVIYYNERLNNILYPEDYSQFADSYLCEVEVYGKCQLRLFIYWESNNIIHKYKSKI